MRSKAIRNSTLLKIMGRLEFAIERFFYHKLLLNSIKNKVDLQKAVECYRKSAEIYVDMGRFNMAAKAHMTMAELYEAVLSGGEAARTTMLSPEAVCLFIIINKIREMI
jgi:hypothetical protein